MSVATNRVPMTKNGEEKLRTELNRLKNEARPRIIEAIATARALGDLKENAEYHAAREEQSFTEGRIREIEHKLSVALVIDVTSIPNHGKVIFGATVELINIDTDSSVTYQIVGDDEADIKAAKISVNSPLARGVIGKQQGEEVTIVMPKGSENYLINRVEYK